MPTDDSCWVSRQSAFVHHANPHLISEDYRCMVLRPKLQMHPDARVRLHFDV
jgi:hypothetical protein